VNTDIKPAAAGDLFNGASEHGCQFLILRQIK
jgi:hypothetical protein